MKVPDVALGKGVNGTATISLTPTGPQQWMWAALAGAVSPVKLSSMDKKLPLRMKVPNPVPGLPVGGTSLDPRSVAVGVMVWAGGGVASEGGKTRVPVDQRRVNIQGSPPA